MKGITWFLFLSPVFFLAGPAPPQASRPSLAGAVEKLFSGRVFTVRAFDMAAAQVRLASGSLAPLEKEAKKRKGDRAARVLVEVYRAQGRKKEAYQAARAFQKMRPGDPEAAILCARLSEELGNNREARAWFRKALESKPSRWQEWECRICLALLAFSEGRRKDALAQLRGIAFLDMSYLAATAARVAGLHGEKAFAARYAGPIQSRNRKRRFLSLLQAARFQEEGGLLEKAGKTLAQAAALARSPRERRYTAWARAELAERMGKLEDLVAGWLKRPRLDHEHLAVAVRSLGMLGKAGEALALLDRPEAKEPGAREWISLLLTFALDEGEVDTALRILREEIDRDPACLETRLHLSRILVDLGRMDEAEAVWREAAALPRYRTLEGRLTLCKRIREAGFISLAEDYLRKAYRAGKGAWSLWAGLEWARILKDTGKGEKAFTLLEEVEARAGSYPGVLRALGEELERMGFEARAARVYEKVLSLVPGEDLEIHLAWLLPRVGRGMEAIPILRRVWERTSSKSRRRQAANRLLELCAKEGVLGDLADELETKLEKGKITPREVSLLVDLYAKIGDTDSVKDVLDIFARRGGDRKKTLQALSRVYLEAGEIREYEKTLHRLLRLDPAHAKEWWMQLAMGALERSKPKEAGEALRSLAALGGLDPAFKAGVLAFAGLHEEAVKEYMVSLAKDPDQVELWLLVGKELAAAGKKEKALAIFQFLADRPVADDLFVVAMDGLLNLDAPGPILEWAARRVEERLALRPTRLFLYRLLSDFLDTLEERARSKKILEEMVPVGAEQRLTILRELMDLARSSGKRKELIRYGRELMALGGVFPPEVYLSLGEALLKEKKWAEAARVFERARQSLDFVATQKRVARLYLENGKTGLALRIYRRLLLQAPNDPSILVDLASAESAAGEKSAFGTWGRALEMLLSRYPSIEEAERKRTTGFIRNVAARETLWSSVLQGISSFRLEGKEGRKVLSRFMERLASLVRREMEKAGKAPSLDRMPRLKKCLEAYFLLCRLSEDSESAGAMAARVAAWAGPSGKKWTLQQVKSFLALGWAATALKFLDSLSPRERRALEWKASWLIQGEPPPGRPPGREYAMGAVLWRFFFQGPEKARAALATLLAGLSPSARGSMAVELLPLHLLLGDRPGFLKTLISSIQRGGKGGKGAAVSPYTMKRILGSVWRILREEERKVVLETLEALANDKGEPYLWRSLYLDALLASGKRAEGGRDLSGTVEDVCRQSITADSIAMYLLLVPRSKRAAVLERILSEKKGFLLDRLLGLVPLALGKEIDSSVLEVLEKGYRETKKPEDVGRVLLADQTWAPSLPPAVKEPLLRILEKRSPSDLDIAMARVELFLEEGKEKEARDLVRRVLRGGKVERLFRTKWDVLLRRAFRGESAAEMDSTIRKAAERGSVQALLFYVSYLSGRGERERALAFLDDWSARHPKDARVFQARIRLLRELGRHRRALEEFRSWVEGNGDFNSYWFMNLASDLARVGRFREAMEVLDHYRSSPTASIDYSAWNRVIRLVQFPPSPERDRRILLSLRSYFHPSDPRMFWSISYVFRDFPGGESASPLMKAATIPGCLEVLEGALERMSAPAFGGVNPYARMNPPVPWGLYAALVWGYKARGKEKELIARLENVLSREPSAAKPVFLGTVAGYWIPGAERKEWIRKALNLVLLSRRGTLQENPFWIEGLEKAGEVEPARRLRAWALLSGVVQGNFRARNLLLRVLRKEGKKALDDRWVREALLASLPLLPPRVFNRFPDLGSSSFLEPWIEAGRWKEFLGLAGDLVDWYRSRRSPSLARPHLVLAVGFAGDGKREEGRRLLKAAFGEAFSGGRYLDPKWTNRFFALDPEGFQAALEETLTEFERKGLGPAGAGATFLAALALDLVKAGKSEDGARTWKKALALAAEGGISSKVRIGRMAFRGGREEWGAALLAPIFEKGLVEPSAAAQVCSELLSAGVSRSLLRKGLETYLSWCPRKDLALLGPGILPRKEARAFLEKALAENPRDEELKAALAKLESQPRK